MLLSLLTGRARAQATGAAGEASVAAGDLLSTGINAWTLHTPDNATANGHAGPRT